MAKLESCIDSIHPGGMELTNYALSLCLPLNGRWLDIGCGSGETVRLLRDTYGLAALGVDVDACALTKERLLSNYLLCADARALPFEDASMEGVLMECCLSLMNDASKVLRECARVLKDNGMLIISDVYARAQATTPGGALGQLYTKEQLEEMLGEFYVQLFEDHSGALKKMMGQMLLDQGARIFYQKAGDKEAIRRAGAGYYLLLARRRIR